MPHPSTGYQVLLTLHLLCVVGGAGYLLYGAAHVAAATRRGPEGIATLVHQQQVGRGAELLLYGAFLFGVAAVGSSGHRYGFAQAWVSASMALFVVAVGLLHGVVRPAERRWVTVATELSQVQVASPEQVPPQVGVLDGLARRASLGWGGINVAVVAIIVLMVFRPGA